MFGRTLRGRGIIASTVHEFALKPVNTPSVWVWHAFGTSSSTKEKYRILMDMVLYILRLFVNGKVPERSLSSTDYSITVTHSCRDPADPVPSGTPVHWSKT